MSLITNSTVQNTRKPKWDWDIHFPRMLELYNNEWTIPEIHKAIQCPNFEPSLRSVYDKFKKENYPTSHDRHPGSYCAGSPADVEAGGPPILPRHSGGRTRHHIRPKEETGGTTESHRLKKLTSFTSFFPKKNNVSKPWVNQISALAKRDSGHYSSRGTISSRGAPSTQYLRDSGYYSTGSCGAPSTLYSIESMTSQGEPLTEIQGLYRVDCHTPHEPTFPSEYRRMKPCNVCCYSDIHNLAWISSCLILNEFEDELKTERIYDFEALDAAGNSALHYAAASGASYDHLKALILAGVPPYQQNTAKQNFLHCLPPSDIGTDNWDPNYSNVNLIGLLELLEPKDIFGQQDNDGQTVLHVLTLHITDPEVKKQIIRKFTQSGFPPIVLDRFGSYATLNDPPWWTEIIHFPSDPADDTVGTSSPDLEVLGTEWEDNPYDPIIQAYGNPHSFDRKTKDTILHALSRVNVESRGSIQSSDMIKYLLDFVTKGVNRNWHNAEGQTPLTAFIYNKDLRGSETGATMAKYIDVILWKDCELFQHNEINVDMMNRRGATALYEAAIRGQAHTVRSLIEAGANVNARLNNDPKEPSVLKATLSKRDATSANDQVCHHMFTEVISYLELAGAVENPSSFEVRGRSK